MPSSIENTSVNAEKNAPNRWIVYLEKKQSGPAIFSRRGPDSRTKTFPTLEHAREYVMNERLEDNPTWACIRYFRVPG